MTVSRCKWAQNIKDQEYLEYHDKEWSTSVRDDRSIFELLTLEGAMAGLSWLTILKKRNSYRREYKDFDIGKVSKMTEKDAQEIFTRGDVVKHSGKIKSVIINANACVDLIAEYGSLAAYFDDMLEGEDTTDLTVTTAPVSDIAKSISKDLKKRGFSFVGPTTVQSFLQASGFFQSHDNQCFRYKG